MQFEIRGVSKRYDTRRQSFLALDGIDIDIPSGEFLCLLGPSGCGKSTLLNMIAGLAKPSEGRVLAEGEEIAGPHPDRVLMFQEPALFPWMSVVDNVAFGLEAAGMAKPERRARAGRFLDLTGLSAFHAASPHELSGGMKQRAALARALALDPKALLMDEPFGALDAQTRDNLHEELQKIWAATKKTIVFVTHNVREALILGDRVLLMTARPGRIKREFRFDIPRPRHFEDSGIAEAARIVLADLRDEVRRANDMELPHEV